MSEVHFQTDCFIPIGLAIVVGVALGLSFNKVAGMMHRNSRLLAERKLTSKYKFDKDAASNSLALDFSTEYPCCVADCERLESLGNFCISCPSRVFLSPLHLGSLMYNSVPPEEGLSPVRVELKNSHVTLSDDGASVKSVDVGIER